MVANPMLFSDSPQEVEAATNSENYRPSQVLFYTHGNAFFLFTIFFYFYIYFLFSVVDQMDNLNQLIEADVNPTLKSSEIIQEVFSSTFNPELALVPSSRMLLIFTLLCLTLI